MTTATQGIDPEIGARFVRIETRLDAMATKEDLANLGGEIGTRMESRFGEQDAKITANHGELKADMANLRAELIRWTVGAIAVSTTIVVSVVTIVE